MSRFALAGLSVVWLALAACAGPESGESASQAEAGAAVQPASQVQEAALEPSLAGGGTSQSGASAPAPRAPAEIARAAPLPAGREPAAQAPAAESAPPAAAESSADGIAIVRRAERAYEGLRSLEADFTQVVTVPLLESTQRSRGKIYHRRPDRFLMKFTDPAGDIVVADGRHLWMYYPSTDPKQVMRTAVGAGGAQVDLQREFLSNPTQRYHVSHQGSETVAGRPADILLLTPKAASSFRRVRIWVDREDALVRRFEVTEENESVRTLEMRGLKPNVSLGDELFRFAPPPGAQVFDQ